MRRDTWTNTQRSWLQTGFPFTIGLMVCKLLTLFALTSALLPFILKLAFIAPDGLRQPWSLFTYSLLGSGPFINFLFDVGITYWFCSSLERSWGTRNFAIFFATVTVVSALSLTVGALLFQTQFGADNLLPVAACAVAWGMLNSEEQVSLFFIPMRGIYMALVSVLFIMYNYASSGGWLAVPFALMGCAAAYFWVKQGISYKLETMSVSSSRPATRPNLTLVPPKTAKPKDDRFSIRDLNPFEWLAKARRKKQFEKLMRDD